MMDEMYDLLYKFFGDGKIIWFDYIDHVKSEYGIERKGLRYSLTKGFIELYIISEDGEEILFTTLHLDDFKQIETIINCFKY